MQNNKTTAAISIKNLHRRFGETIVLRDLNLEIYKGECVAVTGPNGSGKTTLLRILATLLLPTNGDARILGHSVSQEREAALKHIGWVPASDGGFVPRFTGLENLLFFGALRKIRENDVINAIRKWDGLAPFEKALKTPFHQCSTGMKQILSIGRALLGEPGILLLDEPTRSLDSESSQAVRALIANRSSGKTIIFATHSTDDIDLATRVVKL